MKKIRIGTRKSILALKQTQIVADMLREKNSNLEIEIVKIDTTGDKNLKSKLSNIGSKGLFTREIEQMLLDKNIDMAVHSLKDMPTKFDKNLKIGAYIKRDSHKDVIVFNKDYKCIDDLPKNAKIGTSSIRREVQIKKKNPNFDVQNIRGNINTRLKKMTEENFDAIILAKAGLERLDMLNSLRYQELDIISAVSQGCICVQVCEENKDIICLLSSINDEITQKCVEQERAFLKNIGGGCSTPVGAYCYIDENLHIEGFLYDERTNTFHYEQISGSYDIGKKLAKLLMDKKTR